MMTRRRVLGRVAALLLPLGAEHDAAAGSWDDFFQALIRDNGTTVSTLLLRGFDPNTVNEQGQPGLVLALREESFAVAEALMLSPLLKVDLPNAAGETALMLAALKGRLDWMRRLLARGAAVNREGWTPLHYAASGPEPAAVQLLIERGADLDARSPNGSTPLMMAAGYGPVTAAEVLLARGADPRLANEQDLDAADFARRADRPRLADQIAAAARRRMQAEDARR
jgi:ankyrin repeat protein